MWKESSPSTGVKAYPTLGEIGALLKQQKDQAKEMSYVQSCLDHLRNGKINPQFRMPGTLTCRLAGSGGLNLQQIPKSRGYLECWKPLPGKSWIDCDHTSLEQVVLAELSQDNALFKIYGPSAKPNDIYLFNGSQLPIIGDKIRAAGYDPDNPTVEAIAHVKKVCKKERGISKVITLGSSYGMGAAKLRMTLGLQGIEVSPKEAKAMVESYWNIYAGVKDYEKFLLEEYEKNNGWVLNGIGRPVGIAKDYIKDIVNRVIQSTGHDVHMEYVRICDALFLEAGLNVNGIVWDFHDQSIVECKTEDKDIVYEILGTKAYEILNDKYLNGVIKLQGDPQHIATMADAKCE
jgi:DNA polymerase I-like protein with 3'-5' exonuclease and polymerase domains